MATWTSTCIASVVASLSPLRNLNLLENGFFGTSAPSKASGDAKGAEVCGLNLEKFESHPLGPTIYLSLCFEQQTTEPISPFRTHRTDSRCPRGGPQRLEQIADGEGCGVPALATSPANYRGSGPTCPPLGSYEKNWMPCARAIGVSAMVRQVLRAR
jgi:hypothetical protein